MIWRQYSTLTSMDIVKHRRKLDIVMEISSQRLINIIFAEPANSFWIYSISFDPAKWFQKVCLLAITPSN